MSDETTSATRVRTCLWFEKGGLEAARFYVSLLPDSRMETDWDGPGEPQLVEFELAGAPFQILNGGPHFSQSEAASILVSTSNQTETDRLWHALVADGGRESMCGWLKDRWGVSWQIVPDLLPKLLNNDDRAAADRAMQAMLKMNKIDIATLERAFRGR